MNKLKSDNNTIIANLNLVRTKSSNLSVDELIKINKKIKNKVDRRSQVGWDKESPFKNL